MTPRKALLFVLPLALWLQACSTIPFDKKHRVNLVGSALFGAHQQRGMNLESGSLYKGLESQEISKDRAEFSRHLNAWRYVTGVAGALLTGIGLSTLSGGRKADPNMFIVGVPLSVISATLGFMSNWNLRRAVEQHNSQFKNKSKKSPVKEKKDVTTIPSPFIVPASDGSVGFGAMTQIHF